VIIAIHCHAGLAASVVSVKHWLSGSLKHVYAAETLSDLMIYIHDVFHLSNTTIPVRLYFIDNDLPTQSRILVTPANFTSLLASAVLQNGHLFLFPEDNTSPPGSPAQPGLSSPPIYSMSESSNDSTQEEFQLGVMRRHEDVGKMHCSFCERDSSAVGGMDELQAVHLLQEAQESRLNSAHARNKYGILGINDPSNGVLLCTACHTLFDKHKLVRNKHGKLSASSSLLADERSIHVRDRIGAVVDIGKHPLSPSQALWEYREDCFRAVRKERRAKPFRCSHCSAAYKHEGPLLNHMGKNHPDELPAARAPTNATALHEEEEAEAAVSARAASRRARSRRTALQINPVTSSAPKRTRRGHENTTK
jgi:hypothetical protein